VLPQRPTHRRKTEEHGHPCRWFGHCRRRWRSRRSAWRSTWGSTRRASGRSARRSTWGNVAPASRWNQADASRRPREERGHFRDGSNVDWQYGCGRRSESLREIDRCRRRHGMLREDMMAALRLGKLRLRALAGRALAQKISQACGASRGCADEIRSGEARDPDRAAQRHGQGSRNSKDSMPAAALHDLTALPAEVPDRDVGTAICASAAHRSLVAECRHACWRPRPQRRPSLATMAVLHSTTASGALHFGALAARLLIGRCVRETSEAR